MGKASRKKKERKLAKQEEEKNPKKTKAKKVVKSKKKGSKKAKSPKKKTATVLEIKAEKKEKKVSKDQKEQKKIKLLAAIDPEKLAAFKQESKKVVKGGAYIITTIIFAIAIIISIEVHSHNRVLAGTRAGNIDLSYLEYEQAKESLQTGLRDYFQSPVEFTLNGETKTLSLEQLEIRPLVEQTIAQIPVINFETTNPVQLLTSIFKESSIVPYYTLDGDKIIKELEKEFGITEQRAKNAVIVFKDDEFQIEPEKSGQAIDREALISSLGNRIDNLDKSPLRLTLIPEQPRVTVERLDKEKDRLLELLKQPITLNWEDESLTLKLIDHLDAVSFKEKTSMQIEESGVDVPVQIDQSGRVITPETSPVDINGDIAVALNQDKIVPFLDENLISDIEIPTSPANIYTNEEGNVVIEGKGEDGRSVSRTKLIEAMELAVNNGLASVPVPVTIEHAPLTISEDLQETGIKELIATGHSAYYGSPANRMFNIDFGSKKYNGLLIPPGEEFSFNAVLGPVDATSGFKPEKVIKKDKLEYEYGGGICQVSTTFYRAVLQAGLPITERKPHSWKVSYYSQSMGDGLDATIYPGVADLKFVNDTPATILIQAYTEGAEAYFKIYGTNDGRNVVLDGPYGGGLTYRWNRIITTNGEEKTEEIWSRYRPIPPPEPAEKPAPVATAPEASTGGVEFNF